MTAIQNTTIGRGLLGKAEDFPPREKGPPTAEAAMNSLNFYLPYLFAYQREDSK